MLSLGGWPCLRHWAGFGRPNFQMLPSPSITPTCKSEEEEGRSRGEEGRASFVLVLGHRAGRGAGATSRHCPACRGGRQGPPPGWRPHPVPLRRLPPPRWCPHSVWEGSPGRRRNGAAGGGSSVMPGGDQGLAWRSGEETGKACNEPGLVASFRGQTKAWPGFTCARSTSKLAKPPPPAASALGAKASAVVDPVACFPGALPAQRDVFLSKFSTLHPQEIHLNEDQVIKKKIFISCTRIFFFVIFSF